MFNTPLRFAALLLLATQAAFAAALLDLDRELVLTPQAGATCEDAEIRHWQQRASAPAATAADFERLGWAFVAKARRTLDGAYYTLAEKTADASDRRFGANEQMHLLRRHAFHNEHRFH